MKVQIPQAEPEGAPRSAASATLNTMCGSVCDWRNSQGSSKGLVRCLLVLNGSRVCCPIPDLPRCSVSPCAVWGRSSSAGQMCTLLKASRLPVTTSWRAQGIVGEKDAHAHSQFSYFLKVDDSNCDQELLALLVDARLLVKCVSTPFYPHIVAHLVATSQQGLWDAEELARHLQEAGHEVEAGSLLLAVQGTHRAFRTFSTALSAVRQWV